MEQPLTQVEDRGTSPSIEPPTEPHALNRPVGSQEAKGGLLTTLEDFLKVSAAGLGMVAAMGIPAVYVNFTRYGLPTHFMSNEQFLRAGILPTVFLVVVGIYVYYVLREYKSNKGTFRSVAMLIFLSVPFVIIPLITLLIGALSLILLYIWAILWTFGALFSVLFNITVASRTLLYISPFVLLTFVIIYLLLQFTYMKWKDKKGIFWNVLRMSYKYINRTKNITTNDKEGKETNGAKNITTNVEKGEERKTPGKNKDEWSKILIWLPPTILALLILVLYAFKAVIYIWDPKLSPMVSHKFIFLFGVGNSIIYFAFILLIASLECLGSTERRIRSKGIFIIVSIVTFTYITSVAFYSYFFYPRMSYGLGGGKPTPINIWIDENDFPIDMQKKLFNAKFRQDSNVIRGTNIYLFQVDVNHIVILDSDIPPTNGIQLPSGKIKAISW